MAAIIQVDGLERRFGNVQALDGLRFAVEEGEVFGVLGPNGAGKTTCVRVLNGVLAADRGQVRVLGMDPAAQGCEIRRRAGVLTETPSLYERLSGRDNLATFAALYDVPQTRVADRVDELLAQFGLLERAGDKVAGYSKGMKQRLALARALLHDPTLLYLDEPTAGLDPQAAHDVTQMIEQLSHQRGRTVLLCTHNLDEAQRLCDRVAVLNRGRLLALGTLAELERTLWHGLWIDVQLAQPIAESATAGLRALAGVTQVQCDGTGLAAQVDSTARVPDLVTALVAAGARILAVNPRQHTLEDIYFQIQEQAKEA